MWLTVRLANNVTRMLCDFWTKLVTIAAASSFTRMKTRASTLPFFLACLLLEMRNALLANGLKEFSRGKLTDSWEHLPLFREAAQSGAKKQTVSNTEDTTYYVADQFNGMVSRSTNPRQFLQESKVSFLCLLDPFNFTPVDLVDLSLTAELKSKQLGDWSLLVFLIC